MKQSLINELICCNCSGNLSLDTAILDEEEIEKADLRCRECNAVFKIENGIPRFVGDNNYTHNFGLQWNIYSDTQLDSHTGHPISRNRFLNYSGWDVKELENKRVLDVGCGSGRFTEIALSYGAFVVALDYSSSVDACKKNLSPHPRLDIVQADVYALPFPAESFDFVYCFGVLQHTPDPAKAFSVLPGLLKSGGKLAIDVYPKLLRNYLWPKYWLRPISSHVSPQTLYSFVKRVTKYLLPVSVAISKIPLVGNKLKYIIPVVNYHGVYPLSKEQQLEFSTLDTFDMFSPKFDNPQSLQDIEEWFSQTQLIDTKIFRDGFYVGRGSK